MTDRPIKVAYLTGNFPRYSDVWLQREIEAVRGQGINLETFSVRRTDPQQLTDDHQRRLHATTTTILPLSPGMAIRAAAFALVRPRRLCRAIKLALQTRSPGTRAAVMQVVYLAEASVLAKQLRSSKIDHLHNHLSDSSCTVALLASALSGVPYSFSMHGPGIFFEPMRWRIDIKIRHASFVNCISYFCRSQAAAFVEPEHWPKLRIVHCGVDTPSTAPLRPARPGSAELVCVVRLAAAKGLPILLDAVSQLVVRHPRLRLTIVGDGPDRDDLQRRIDSNGLHDHVTLAGPASPSEVRAQLDRSDLFVLPSFAEGVPVVLMEAMAAGVPVVATLIAGVPELIQHGKNGILVPPANPVALAEAIHSLLDDGDQRDRIGRAGRETVRNNFDATTEGQRIAECLRRTVAGDPGSTHALR